MGIEKNDIQLITGDIPLETYQNLRLQCGLSAKSIEAAKIGLRNILHAVTLKSKEDIIGMGKIVGDGGFFFPVVDICVHPNFQGMGFGKLIMENLTKFINRELPKSC